MGLRWILLLEPKYNIGLLKPPRRQIRSIQGRSLYVSSSWGLIINPAPPSLEIKSPHISIPVSPPPHVGASGQACPLGFAQVKD